MSIKTRKKNKWMRSGQTNQWLQAEQTREHSKPYLRFMTHAWYELECESLLFNMKLLTKLSDVSGVTVHCNEIDATFSAKLTEGPCL